MALVSMRRITGSRGRKRLRTLASKQPRTNARHYETADQVNAPVIVQASATFSNMVRLPFLHSLILAAVEEFPHSGGDAPRPRPFTRRVPTLSISSASHP